MLVRHRPFRFSPVCHLFSRTGSCPAGTCWWRKADWPSQRCSSGTYAAIQVASSQRGHRRQPLLDRACLYAGWWSLCGSRAWHSLHLTPFTYCAISPFNVPSHSQNIINIYVQLGIKGVSTEDGCIMHHREWLEHKLWAHLTASGAYIPIVLKNAIKGNLGKAQREMEQVHPVCKRNSRRMPVARVNVIRLSCELMHKCTHTQMHTCTHTHIYAHIHTQMHTHTHTHTHTHSLACITVHGPRVVQPAPSCNRGQAGGRCGNLTCRGAPVCY
jgi:hypothetical protein